MYVPSAVASRKSRLGCSRQLKLYEERTVKQVRERWMGQCVLVKLALGLGCPDLWLLQFS